MAVFPATAWVGQQGTLTRIRAERGTRHRAPRDTRHTWAFACPVEPMAFAGSLSDADCAGRGATAVLAMPRADTRAMNAHLAGIARNVAEGAHAGFVLDGAGRHGSRALVVPDNTPLLALQPYSRELKPVENVCACMRANRRTISVVETRDEIVTRWCAAWNTFAKDAPTGRAITARHYAKPVKGQNRWYEADPGSRAHALAKRGAGV